MDLGFSYGIHTSTGWGGGHITGMGRAGRSRDSEMPIQMARARVPPSWPGGEPVTVIDGSYSQSKGNDGNRALAVTVRAALSQTWRDESILPALGLRY